MSWNYHLACQKVLEEARRDDPRRMIRECDCGTLFLTPRGMPGIDECGYCYRRRMRELDEAADRELFEAWRRGEVSDEVAGLPVLGEPVAAAPAQGSLF